MKIINETLVFVEHNVMNVTIPDSVTGINDFAFSNCRNLTSITIPDNVTSIGISAFSHCINLTSITIPDGITSIGRLAFYGCTSLRYNTYNNAQYLGNAQNPYLVLVKATAKGITSCAIHARARVIYGSAFDGCMGLTSITIPNGVTSIGSYAFRNCSGLTNVVIPDSVTSIGDEAFYNCTGLTSITIGDGVTSIGGSAFRGCTKLQVNANGNYKAFIFDKNHNLMAGCKHKKYRIGHKSFARGVLECCHNGLHYCTNPFDIFNYYCGDYETEFVIALCDVSPENVGHKDDSKHCARWVRPTHILTRQELIALLNNPIKGGE